MAWNIDPNPYVADVFDNLSEAEQNYVRRHPTPKLVERTLCWLNDLSVSHNFIDTPDPFGLLNTDGTFKWYRYRSSPTPEEFVPSLESPFELTESDLRVQNFWDYLKKVIIFTCERTLRTEHDLAFENLSDSYERYLWDASNENSWHHGPHPNPVTSVERPFPWGQFTEPIRQAGKPSCGEFFRYLPHASQQDRFWGLLLNTFRSRSVSIRLRHGGLVGPTFDPISSLESGHQAVYDAFLTRISQNDFFPAVNADHYYIGFGWSEARAASSGFSFQGNKSLYLDYGIEQITVYLPLHFVSENGLSLGDYPIAFRTFIGADNLGFFDFNLVYNDSSSGFDADTYRDFAPGWTTLKLYYRWWYEDEPYDPTGNNQIPAINAFMGEMVANPGTEYASVEYTGLSTWSGTGPHTGNGVQTISRPHGFDESVWWEDPPPRDAKWLMLTARPDPFIPEKLDLTDGYAFHNAGTGTFIYRRGQHYPNPGGSGFRVGRFFSEPSGEFQTWDSLVGPTEAGAVPYPLYNIGDPALGGRASGF